MTRRQSNRFAAVYFAVSMSLRMPSTFQAVVRGPSFIGLGNRPVLTPAHHVERPTGTDGALEEWTLYSLGIDGLIRGLTRFAEDVD